MNETHIHSAVLAVLCLCVLAALPLWLAHGPTVAFRHGECAGMLLKGG
jgi:hypothetical protein